MYNNTNIACVILYRDNINMEQQKLKTSKRIYDENFLKVYIHVINAKIKEWVNCVYHVIVRYVQQCT